MLRVSFFPFFFLSVNMSYGMGFVTIFQSSGLSAAVGGHESDNADDVDIGDGGSDNEIDPHDAFDEQKACISVAKFFCSAGLPPQTANEYHFRALSNHLNPQFRGSVADIGRYCLETYDEVKAKIKQVLSNLEGQMSLSIDILRYEKRYYYVQDYLCLSAHFIDSNWKMKKWILRFRRDDLKELPHEFLLNAVKEWEIEGKVSAITMLNDHLFDETFELVQDHIIGNRELKLNGRMYRVYCAGDMVSRMVQGAYKPISKTIDIVSELYPFWKSQPLWYLTSFKLKDASELESKGEYSSDFVLDNYRVPSADEWEKVRSICELVDSIYKVTEVLFQAKYPTANIYLYHLRELREILLEKSTSSDVFIQGVAKKMLKKFDKYWKKMYLVLAVAMVMDPRFKMKYLEFTSSEFDDSDGIPGFTTVLEAIRGLFNDYVTQFPEKDYDDSKYSTSSESASDLEEEGEEESGDKIEEEPRNLDDIYKLLPDYFQFVQSASRPPKSELDWYLEEPVVPWSHDFNALSWWRSASAKYPVLSKMARNLLGIPLSVATSYEAFYTEPREADERIIRSGPKMMNALMCTKSWYPWP